MTSSLWIFQTRKLFPRQLLSLSPTKLDELTDRIDKKHSAEELTTWVKARIHLQFLSWLGSSVVRASDDNSEGLLFDPQQGCRACFFVWSSSQFSNFVGEEREREGGGGGGGVDLSSWLFPMLSPTPLVIVIPRSWCLKSRYWNFFIRQYSQVTCNWTEGHSKIFSKLHQNGWNVVAVMGTQCLDHFSLFASSFVYLRTPDQRHSNAR